MTVIKPSHFIVVPTAMWGHLRPLLHLSLNLITLHPNLHLTLLVTPSILPRVEHELKSTSFAHIYTKSPPGPGTSSPNPDLHHITPQEQIQEDKAIADKLQIITCISPEFNLPKEWSAETMAQEGMDYAQTVPKFIKALVSKEHRLAEVENKYDDIPPNFLIYDTFLPFIPEVMRGVMSELQKPMLPLIGFVPSNAAATWHTFAEEETGGHFRLASRLIEEDIANGMDTAEAHVKHAFGTYGKVKTIPGLPPKFDWPNLATVPMPPQAFMGIIPSAKAAKDPAVHGLVCPTTAEIEPEAVEALEKEMGYRIYMAGPQFPESAWAGEHPEPKAKNEDDEKVFAFLDKMKKKHGINSVIYVSMGSLFFPATRPELIRYILKSLKDNGFPFVYAYASQMAPIPEDLQKELDDNEDSCAVKFAPQWDVVNHEATGYFLSHCGSNSTAEAILAELPMVSMPFAADQGEFTSLLSEIYKVSIDLKQVKTFRTPEFNKLYDGTIVVGTEEAIKAELKQTWDTLRGPEGEAMRERMKALKATIKKSWADGRSKKDMLALGTCFE
ncbi:uncharacterized protein I206_105215 [Kwoniella pini CBS 10737]|uniref:UDP-glycosyltransferases domain-containing protein n=1 Tax=Kwoniella pini CBS 10737 TaxID=1296096 RepID=A0AAJ8L6Y1_9TREE